MIGYLKRHPEAVKRLVWGYIVFEGCFAFPIGSQKFPLDTGKLCMLLSIYGIAALCFVGIYGPHREKTIYAGSLLFTVLGLVCRYFLEYGEVSNTYNFTAGNIAAYLIWIPLGVTAAYAVICKKLPKGEESPTI